MSSAPSYSDIPVSSGVQMRIAIGEGGIGLVSPSEVRSGLYMANVCIVNWLPKNIGKYCGNAISVTKQGVNKGSKEGAHHHQRLNDEAGKIVLSDPSLISRTGGRGELLQRAIHSSGYVYKKG